MKPQPTINALDAFYRFIVFGGHHTTHEERAQYGVTNRSFVADHPDPITGEESQRIFIEFDLDGCSMTITAMQFQDHDSITDGIGPIQIETRQTYELTRPGFLSSMQMDELDDYFDKVNPTRKDNDA